MPYGTGVVPESNERGAVPKSPEKGVVPKSPEKGVISTAISRIVGDFPGRVGGVGFRE